MILTGFDDKCLRIRTVWGETMEGECFTSGDAECGEIMYGREEAFLHVANFLFYEGDIADIEVLSGPEEFSGPFGLIEELNMQDGAVSVDSELTCESDICAKRMMACIRHYRDPANGLAMTFELADIRGALEELAALTEDEEAREEANKLLAEI